MNRKNLAGRKTIIKKKKKENSNIVRFSSKGPIKKVDDVDDGEIIDHGKLGNLSYEVYKRGVIHIFTKSLKFKKDCDLFEDEINDLELEEMEVGDHKMMKGSGDNDHLMFEHGEDGIVIKLEKRGHDLVAKLKSLISMGKNKKEVS